MVLAALGRDIDEASLRECCRTTVAGTRADDVVACARQHGFDAEHMREADVTALRRWLAARIFPIVMVNMYPLDAIWRMHAVVVVGFDDAGVHLLDPAGGARTVGATAFDQAWQMNLRRAVLVRRRS
jgi:ABC-type bacteriocin/lantibiotic exporter with double-glycine peptidase domain